MIIAATVINRQGEANRMELENPKTSGFSVRDIQGLGPVKAVINMSKVSTVDGEVYNSSTVGGRNIVFKLGLDGSDSVEESRHQTYRYFPIKQKITIIFETTTRMAVATGYVESNEPDIFSPDSTANISILCEDAYFYDATEQGTVNTLFYTVEKAFEFPFENTSLTEKTLEMGRIKTEYGKDINYTGDSEVGITITINALGDVGDLVIYNPETNEAMRISSTVISQMTGFGISAGDTIVITTHTGNKTVTLTRNGISRNILNALERGSPWLKMQKGYNQFAYSASYGSSNLQMSMESRIVYEGL